MSSTLRITDEGRAYVSSSEFYRSMLEETLPRMQERFGYEHEKLKTFVEEFVLIEVMARITCAPEEHRYTIDDLEEIGFCDEVQDHIEKITKYLFDRAFGITEEGRTLVNSAEFSLDCVEKFQPYIEAQQSSMDAEELREFIGSGVAVKVAWGITSTPEEGGSMTEQKLDLLFTLDEFNGIVAKITDFVFDCRKLQEEVVS